MAEPLSFFTAALDSPEQAALLCRGRLYSYRELSPLLERAAGALTSLGASSDSLVAVCATNQLETFITLAALISCGIPFIPIHPRLTQEERRVILEDASPGLFLEEERLSSLVQREAITEIQRSPVSPEQLLAVMYTSGTTGKPKGAMLSRSAFLASALASAEILGWRDDDRWLLCMPLCHIGGLSILTRCLLARRCVVLQERFTPQEVLRAIEEEGVTLLSVVPTMLQALLVADQKSLLARLRAILVGGAAAPSSILEECARRGIQALTTYGLTEACSQVTTQRPRTQIQFEPGSGTPLPGMEVKILGDDGRPMPSGEVGHIYLRGPSLMRGYLHDPQPMPELLDTKDLGSLDEEGRLFIASRRVDLIVTGGENVYPAEVERALEACPGVARALVFGVPEEVWGQQVAVAIEPTNSFHKEAAASMVRANLAKHKQPRWYCLVEEIPMLPSGKPDRAGAYTRLHQKLTPW